MAEELAFCNARVTVSMQGQRVGIITITKIFYAPDELTSETDFLAIAHTNISSAMTKRTNPYGFLEIMDSEDPRFKVMYNFNGPPCHEIARSAQLSTPW